MLLSEGNIITRSVEVFSAESQKNKGLMWKKPADDTVYFFYYSKPSFLLLHMFFVFYRLDIIFLDSDLHVLKILNNVAPFTPVIFPPKSARHFMECRVGYFNKVKVGDKLTIV